MLLNIYAEHPILSDDFVVVPIRLCIDLQEATDSLINCSDEVEYVVSCMEVKWVTCHGSKFVAESCSIAFGENGTLPEFGMLKCIWVYEQMHSKRSVFFGLQMFNNILFNRQIQSYEVVKPPNNDNIVFVDAMKIFLPMPLHCYVLADKCVITTPYDMHDIVRKKQGL